MILLSGADLGDHFKQSGITFAEAFGKGLSALEETRFRTHHSSYHLAPGCTYLSDTEVLRLSLNPAGTLD